jgi:hypothetical protein
MILVFLVPQRGALRKRGEVWFGGEGAQVAGAISRVSTFECVMWTSNGITGENGNESENGSGNGNDGKSGMVVGHAPPAGAEGSATAGILRARWQRLVALCGILTISQWASLFHA